MPKSLFNRLLIVCAVCVALPGNAALAEDETGRKGILANPYDFSQPPELPEIDAPTQEQIRDAIDRGVAYLIKSQRKSGAWGSATQTKGLNIYAPVPGAHDAFRCGTTSLSISSLLEVAPNNSEAMEAVAGDRVNRLEDGAELVRRVLVEDADALEEVLGDGHDAVDVARLDAGVDVSAHGGRVDHLAI